MGLTHDGPATAHEFARLSDEFHDPRDYNADLWVRGTDVDTLVRTSPERLLVVRPGGLALGIAWGNGYFPRQMADPGALTWHRA